MAEETGGSNILDGLNNSLNAFLSKIGDAIKSNLDAKEIAKTVVELDDSAVGIAKAFGQGRENVQAIKASMADAYISVVKLGGELKDIVQIQKDASEALGRNLILSSESYEKLYATSEVTGVGAKTLITNFKDAGFSAYQAGSEMEKVVNQARAVGVSAQAVSSKVVENMSALNKFGFEGGVSGLAKMAAQATSLRIDMKTALDFAEKVYNPEQAIEMAAAFQRLGVANSELLDPLRLMDLSQNDPAELQNQIVKMTQSFAKFNEETGKFEIPVGAQRQLREIAQQTGIGYEQLTKMALGAQELDMKLTKIKFPDTFTEEQKQLFANMSEMGKDGEFKITVDGSEMNLADAMAKAQNNPEFFKSLEESSKPKSMEELAKSQLTVLNSINADIKSLTKVPMAVARGKTATQALELPAQLTKVMSETFDTQALSIKNLGKGFDEGAQDILKSLTSLASGEGSLTEVLGKLQENGKKMNDFAEQAFSQSAEKYMESVKQLTNSNNTLYKLFEQTFKGVIEGGKDFATGNDYNFNNPKPTVAPTVPTNIEKVKEVTNQQNVNPQTTQPVKTESTITANVNLNITAPPNIDNAQLMVALQNTEVKQALVDAVSSAPYNDGLTSNTSNRAQARLTQNQNTGILG